MARQDPLKWTTTDSEGGDKVAGALAGIGDIDGDGRDELLLGITGDDDLAAGAGAVVIVEPDAELAASDAEASAQFGISVSPAGDVNGDGFADMVVGALEDSDQGAAYVYYGSVSGLSTRAETRLTASDATAGDDYGISVAGGGDIDGDGYDDVVIGAPGADASSGNEGAIYVYYGDVSGIGSSSEGKLTATDGDKNDRFGTAVTVAGDLDGDGLDDVVVGVPDDSDAGTDSGAVYVYYGSTTGLDGGSEQKVYASDVLVRGAQFGYSVAGAGDVDHDG